MPPFHEFGPDHLAALAVVGLLCCLAGRWGRRLPAGQRLWTGRVLGLLLAAYAASYYAVTVAQRGWSWGNSLPLNICDWVLVACLVALFRPAPLAFEIAYFWGLAGTLQGLLTPDLRSGFPTFRYFHFFWGHGGILVAIVWLIAADGLRPRPGSAWRMLAAVNFYAVSVGLLDFLFGWNYGYLRHGPGHFSLLSYLGGWPWYLLWAEVIALGSFVLLELPWKANSLSRQPSRP